MKNKILLIGLVVFSLNLKAQNTTEEFQPEGNVYGIIFSNFHSSLNSDIDNSGFEIQRVYLGYKYKMSSNFSANIKLDIGMPDNTNTALKRYVFIRNAELQYTKGKLKINFGMINLYQFDLQKNVWGHRYIAKTLQNQHKLGNCGDLGMAVVYKFNNILSADFSITNGEGYAKPQLDNAYKSAIGLTVKPTEKITARVYADYMEQQEKEMTFVSFIAYQASDDLRVGVEYAFKNNSAYIADHNIHGLSSYISYNINEKFEVFGRFDRLLSNTLDGDTDPWNNNKDGQAIIAGVQYKPINKLKIAANIQEWSPSDGSEREPYFFINLQYNL